MADHPGRRWPPQQSTTGTAADSKPAGNEDTVSDKGYSTGLTGDTGHTTGLIREKGHDRAESPPRPASCAPNLGPPASLPVRHLGHLNATAVPAAGDPAALVGFAGGVGHGARPVLQPVPPFPVIVPPPAAAGQQPVLTQERRHRAGKQASKWATGGKGFPFIALGRLQRRRDPPRGSFVTPRSRQEQRPVCGRPVSAGNTWRSSERVALLALKESECN